MDKDRTITQEWEVTFHVTSASEELAKQWLEKALSILDRHQRELVEDSDEGAYCSGHVDIK